MRQRGRRSSASLSVVVPDGREPPPTPPHALTDEERAIWDDIVGSLRPGWFKGAEHPLETYVRAISLERFLSEQIRGTDPSDDRRLALLMRCQRDQAAIVASFGTKLRLTPRSNFDRTAPKLASTLPKPWELPDSDLA